MIRVERLIQEILEQEPSLDPREIEVLTSTLVEYKLNRKTFEEEDIKKAITGGGRQIIDRFTIDETEALKNQEFRIYSFGGENILQQQARIKGFDPYMFSIYIEKYPDLTHMPATPTQIALATDHQRCLILESANQPIEIQQDMVRDYSIDLQERTGLQTIEAFIGELPDYTGIILIHSQGKTVARLKGEHLLSPARYGRQGSFMIRTNTQFGSKGYVNVGSTNEGLKIEFGSDRGKSNLFAMPLVRPNHSNIAA